MSGDVRLIAVLGATGVGKSKLAIELAEKFNGEIINCDSMQVRFCRQNLVSHPQAGHQMPCFLGDVEISGATPDGMRTNTRILLSTRICSRMPFRLLRGA